MTISLKRVYEQATPDDGFRVLVDRLWPRGIRKTDLKMDLWAKGLAPSTETRKEFNHDPARFEAFKGRYINELDTSEEARELAESVLSHDKVTLLYAAKDPEINHAVVLKSWLESYDKRSQEALGNS
ncbi:MAG: DUF488 domain-containing protein [Coriobacteriales bacterium]|jgi:uncharacterized protein YeaO (DUF488 family)